jgi:hypothetical protein
MFADLSRLEVDHGEHLFTQQCLTRVVGCLSYALPGPDLRAEINFELVGGRATAFGNLNRSNDAYSNINLLEHGKVDQACLVWHALRLSFI